MPPKQKWKYKKGPATKSTQSSPIRYSRKNGAGKEASTRRMLKPTAQVLWGTAPTGSRPGATKFVQDKTWGSTYHHYSVTQTAFAVKAGSKKMILSGSLSATDGSTSGAGRKISEDQLLRKYRYPGAKNTYMHHLIFACPAASKKPKGFSSRHNRTSIVCLDVLFYYFLATSTLFRSTSSASRRWRKTRRGVRSLPASWTFQRLTRSSEPTPL